MAASCQSSVWLSARLWLALSCMRVLRRLSRYFSPQSVWWKPLSSCPDSDRRKSPLPARKPSLAYQSSTPRSPRVYFRRVPWLSTGRRLVMLITPIRALAP
ncbi:hypothetical protein D3C78_921700 [compost metagenome]